MSASACQSLPSTHHIPKLSVYPGRSTAIMPRSGYSREDPVPRRSGYVSYDNNPVDHRGGPESDSGRINLARMDEGGLHGPDGRLYSSTASDLSQIPARDDLYRSDPSREYERRTRGYNSGYFGEHVPSFGSSPQLGGLDRGYRGNFTLFLS